MFLARAELGENETLLIFGLSRVNRERLAAGHPLDISQHSHGMAIPENLRIMIFAGETEEEMHQQMQSLIGPTTVQNQKKPI